MYSPIEVRKILFYLQNGGSRSDTIMKYAVTYLPLMVLLHVR